MVIAFLLFGLVGGVVGIIGSQLIFGGGLVLALIGYVVGSTAGVSAYLTLVLAKPHSRENTPPQTPHSNEQELI